MLHDVVLTQNLNDWFDSVLFPSEFLVLNHDFKFFPDKTN